MSDSRQPIERDDTSPDVPDPIWKDDLLGRKNDADTIIRFTTERVRERIEALRPGSYVLNIDGAWGSGKTYFLDRLAKQLDQQGYLVAQVNAWEDDHAPDPLIPVIAAIEKAVSAKFAKPAARKKTIETIRKSGGAVAVALGKNVALAAAKAVTGKAFEQLANLPEDLSDALKSTEKGLEKSFERLLDNYAEQLLKRFDEAKASIAKFKSALSALIDSQTEPRPLFVLVDELDRCRPTYAIELLERAKHLFNIDNVVFLFATDTSQLKAAIAAVYGSTFDGQRYLLRFFDRTYTFATPELGIFIKSLFRHHVIDTQKLSAPNDDPVTLATAFVGGYGLELRDAEQCFDLLRDVVTLWDQPVPLELVYLLPLVIATQQRDKILLDALTRFAPIEAFRALSSDTKRKDIVFSRIPNRFEKSPPQIEIVATSDLVSRFLSTFKKSLATASDGPRQEGASGWIIDRFQTEFRIRYGHGGYYPQRPMRSLIYTYPELVRSAAKLTRPPD